MLGWDRAFPPSALKRSIIWGSADDADTTWGSKESSTSLITVWFMLYTGLYSGTGCITNTRGLAGCAFSIEIMSRKSAV